MVRSQIAEALYKKYKNDDVASAGILPQAEQHDGKKLKELNLDIWIQALKDKERIDISSNFCKQVTEEIVGKAERIIVMAEKEIWPAFLKNKKDVIFWEIDENVQTHEQVSEVIDKIKSLILKL